MNVTKQHFVERRVMSKQELAHHSTVLTAVPRGMLREMSLWIG